MKNSSKSKNNGAPLPERRFPPPWSVEETEACFIVKDSGGQKLAYVYFEDEPGRRLPDIRRRQCD
jgi:hypothetical protein